MGSKGGNENDGWGRGGQEAVGVVERSAAKVAAKGTRVRSEARSVAWSKATIMPFELDINHNESRRPVQR